MDNIVWGVAGTLGLVFAVFVIFYIWEVARRAYFAVAAKWYGWSEEEKRERQLARVRRTLARETTQDERQAERDAVAAGDRERRRFGVAIASIAICGPLYQSNLPWWEIGVIAVGVYIGLTM